MKLAFERNTPDSIDGSQNYLAKFVIRDLDSIVVVGDHIKAQEHKITIGRISRQAIGGDHQWRWQLVEGNADHYLAFNKGGATRTLAQAKQALSFAVVTRCRQPWIG